jgi:hypothetical protein
MSSQAIVMVAFCTMMTIVIVVGILADYKSKTKKKDAPAPAPEPPPAFASLSLLAGLSFFSGLGAILLATVSGILSLAQSMGEAIPMTDSTRHQMDLAARIVLYVGLLPAIGAAAFGLAARGVISESKGAVRGRPLYRTGILLSLVTAVLVFNAKILNPTTWLEATVDEAVATPSDVDRGYLGVEYGAIDQSGMVPLVRVVPGSPADRAGLKAGDILERLDGTPVYRLDPAGGNGWSPGTAAPYIGRYIGSLKPGSKITVTIRRGGAGVTSTSIVAELAATFDSLLRLVKSQTDDEERMAVLKAAGADRRYSADELRRICATFDFDDARLKVIETALPKLQDPQNAYQILGSLEFSDSKTRASGWIEALNKPK